MMSSGVRPREVQPRLLATGVVDALDEADVLVGAQLTKAEGVTVERVVATGGSRSLLGDCSGAKHGRLLGAFARPAS